MDRRLLVSALMDERKEINPCGHDGRFLISAFTDERTNYSLLPRELATQAEAFDQGLVARKIAILQIAEQALALIDQLQQATAGMVILLVLLEMTGEVVDASGQQGHLDFGGTGVVRNSTEISNDLAGLFYGKGHGYAFP